MSYLTQAKLSGDSNLLLRVTACAALEGIPNPQSWAYEHAWQLSAQPEWATRYSAALDQHVADPGAIPDPGSNEGAITDAMILDAVRLLNE